MESPSRVFAAILPAERDRGLEVRLAGRDGATKRLRELQVTGTAEVCCPADRASLRVGVSSSKESVGDATGSVSRRLDYILQALRQHGIRDEGTSVRRFLHRDAELYCMDAEVTVTFSDFAKMERVCSVLLEKLDKSVCVGMPQFYHSAECLNQMRQRAWVSAVENAQQKAGKVSQLLGQSLGCPLNIKEEETKEWRNEDDTDEGRRQRFHFPHLPTITASSQVSMSFSLRDFSRKRLS